MKSFSNFITEKKTDLPSGNPTNMPQGDIDALRRQAAGGPREPLSTDAQERKVIRKRNVGSRVIGTPEGHIVTNIPTGSGRTPEEQFARAERSSRNPRGKRAFSADVTNYIARQRDAGGKVSADIEASAARGGADIRKVAGTEPPKPTKPGSYVVIEPPKPPKPEAVQQSAVSAKQAAYRKSVAKKANELLGSMRKGSETSSRMSRGYGKTLAADADAIIQGIGAERRAETAAGNKEFMQQRYGKGKSGPATDLRTPAQTRTYQTGVKKGYFDPKTGRVSETGLQKHINMRAVGGENFGKMGGADPRQTLADVGDAVRRAQSGDKAARREISRSYKSITAKYKPETGARTGFGSADFRSFQQQAANINAPKLTPQKMSMNLPGTQQKPVSSPAAQATKEKLRQKLDLKLQAKSQKGGALGFPVETGITPSKAGKLALGTKPGQLVAPSKPATQPKPLRDTTYTGIGAGKSVEIAGAPKSTKTPLLTPSKTTKPEIPSGVEIPSTYKAPSIDKGPSIDVTSPTSTPSSKKSFKQFTKQAGTTSSRKGSWTYTPQQTAASASGRAGTSTVTGTETGSNIRRWSDVKKQNPDSYKRMVERRAKNIADIRSAKNTGPLKGALKGLGKIAGPAFAAWDAYDVYKQERERGQTKDYATKKAIAQAGGGWAGSAAGAAAGAKIGGALGTLAGPVGTAIGAGIGGIAGGIAGYAGGAELGKALPGASERDKEWMKWANRKVQAGTTADAAQFKVNNKAVITDKSGKERVGYKAYQGGKEVYKHGADPSSLKYTSSNPLERLGRTFLPGMYKASDEAARQRRVQAVKTAASK